jgi:lactoylglutathione lyase
MKRNLLVILTLVASTMFAQNKLPMRINHLALFVQDIKASREFYTQVLGLDSIPEPFHDGKHLWLSMGAGSSLHIIAGAPVKKEYYLNNHLCLSTTHVDDFKKILEKRGIMWYNASGEKGKTTTRVDGVQQVWLQDPDGYWIEINNDKGGVK